MSRSHKVSKSDVVKEKAPEANQKLRDAIKALGNKLRPMIYELGFLKQ